MQYLTNQDFQFKYRNAQEIIGPKNRDFRVFIETKAFKIFTGKDTTLYH